MPTDECLQPRWSATDADDFEKYVWRVSQGDAGIQDMKAFLHDLVLLDSLDLSYKVLLRFAQLPHLASQLADFLEELVEPGESLSLEQSQLGLFLEVQGNLDAVFSHPILALRGLGWFAKRIGLPFACKVACNSVRKEIAFLLSKTDREGWRARRRLRRLLRLVLERARP